jgi:hypothetical protein
LWARTLFDELEGLGFGLSYQSLTRNIRTRNLRPVCKACRTATDRPNAVIPHAPGDDTQWDWLELPDPPESWGWGKKAYLLVGSLAHSGKWRAVLSPSTDQPHLVAAIDQVIRGLGGVTRVWRFDRMATVCDPGSGRVTASFAGVAKHYGVSVAICPARRGNRKGVVEISPADISTTSSSSSATVSCVVPTEDSGRSGARAPATTWWEQFRRFSRNWSRRGV